MRNEELWSNRKLLRQMYPVSNQDFISPYFSRAQNKIYKTPREHRWRQQKPLLTTWQLKGTTKSFLRDSRPHFRTCRGSFCLAGALCYCLRLLLLCPKPPGQWLAPPVRVSHHAHHWWSRESLQRWIPPGKTHRWGTSRVRTETSMLQGHSEVERQGSNHLEVTG